MLDYSRQRALEILRTVRKAVLATSGPEGVEAGEYSCSACDLSLYLLLPATSNHLYNLEVNPEVGIFTPEWEMKGRACLLAGSEVPAGLDFQENTVAAWCVIVRVNPILLQVKGKQGWSILETFEFD